ncbi:hypothetical protein DNTS_009199 [Danionella cerebrum]|uniref:Peroxisomal ATPase PEX6 n=1 Tax=Danionella cerebrum TaxID=2873325 RepID=A0A553MMS7_9TELE|nr:hypothetical protein DNTS_009199 [Danionella translucida]
MAVPMKLQLHDDFPSHIHPLHVVITYSNFIQKFPDCIGFPQSLLLSLSEQHSVSNRGFLVSVHLTPEEEPDVNNSTCLFVHVSRSFLRHYGVKEGASFGTARPHPLLPLSKIVLGARTKRSLRWASSEQFSRGILELASCSDQSLLARQGDVLLLPCHPALGEEAWQCLWDVQVLECAPVCQGRITVETSVVLADCRDLESSAVNKLSPPNLFVSDFAHYASSLTPGGSLLTNRVVDFSAFMQALECMLEVRVLQRSGGFLSHQEQDGALDVDSCVFVSKSLLLKLGVFNGEWVHASVPTERPRMVPLPSSPIPSEEGERGSQKRTVKVNLLSVRVLEAAGHVEVEGREGVGFISPVQWFNLSDGMPVPAGNKAIKIKRRWNETWSPAESKLSASACRSAAPAFAKELHIEVIISPEYNSHGCFDSLLHTHFRIARLVQEGNILGIPTQGDPEFLGSCSEGIPRWPVLYFRVKRVCAFTSQEDEHAAYLADSTHTSLYMGGSTHSPSPCSVIQQGPRFWRSPSPPGLSSTVEKLAFKRSCSILLIGPEGSGKVTAVRAASRRLHLHLLQVDCASLCADTAAASEAKISSVFQRAELHHPSVLLMRNLQLLAQSRDGSETDSRITSFLLQLITEAHARVVVVGSVTCQQDLSSDMMAMFVHQLAIENLSEDQRRAILLSLCEEELMLGKDVDLSRIAKQTAGFVLGDLCALLTSAGRAAHTRLLKTCFAEGANAEDRECLCVSGVCVSSEDFSTALDVLHQAHSQAIGAPKIPSVSWQDIGGLQEVKKEILDTVQLPLEHPELLTLGLRRSGLLLYGPPGTGKTLLAKAVATECSMTFLSVKGPELINMYVGQSEENIREVFRKARTAAPCIVFFDELDSLAPNRGHSGDSGGVMDRVVSQLLAELDGLHSSGDVFVIGATNRPDLLDQSLLRPGRFDKLVYVGVNEDRESQLQVLKAILRKFEVDSSVCLSDVVERCPTQLTGADLYALCSDAMMSAIKRKITRITEGLESEAGSLTLTASDFSQALSDLQPSVSEQELQRYKLIQQKFSST